MKLKIAFICTGNSCRSQMAEGLARHMAGDLFEVYSAGTLPAGEVNPDAVLVMKEAGIDIKEHYPKLLEDIPSELDILITMGCGVVCPYVKNRHQEDWGLEDPAGKSPDEFRRIRDMIRRKLEDLIGRVRDKKL